MISDYIHSVDRDHNFNPIIKMKTLQEAKDKIARNHGFVNWKASHWDGSKYTDEAAELLISEFIDEIKTLKSDNEQWKIHAAAMEDRCGQAEEENEQLLDDYKTACDTVNNIQSELLKAKQLIQDLLNQIDPDDIGTGSEPFPATVRVFIKAVEYLKTTAPVEQTGHPLFEEALKAVEQTKKTECDHKYSRSMYQDYPRKCVICDLPEIVENQPEERQEDLWMDVLKNHITKKHDDEEYSIQLHVPELKTKFTITRK